MSIVIKDPTWRRKLAHRIRKTKKAQAEKAERKARHEAELQAYEQDERFTLIKRK